MTINPVKISQMESRNTPRSLIRIVPPFVGKAVAKKIIASGGIPFGT
jgi:hypothetical protein